MKILKLDKFDQIGIIVKDIKRVSKFLGNLLNFKNKLNLVEQTNTVLYKGKEAIFKMKKIMQNFGGKQFEVIEVIDSDGDHLYSEFLKEGKEGLHHLGIYTKNSDAFIEYFKSEYDINVIQTGKYGKVKFDYLDTKDVIGFYIELISF
ncbi:MAG: VOC family protein [Promethearchaeota archaeon]